MKLHPEQLAWTKLAILIGLAITSLSIWLTVQWPSLQSHRLSLDTDRISLATLEEQRSNQVQLASQAEELQRQQADLDPELWQFTSEPEFFAVWERFGAEHQVELEVQHVADVVPGTQPVRRNAEIAISGSAQNLFQAVNAVAGLKPLVSIQGLRLKAGQTAGQMSMELSLETVWR